MRGLVTVSFGAKLEIKQQSTNDALRGLLEQVNNDAKNLIRFLLGPEVISEGSRSIFSFFARKLKPVLNKRFIITVKECAYLSKVSSESSWSVSRKSWLPAQLCSQKDAHMLIRTIRTTNYCEIKCHTVSGCLYEHKSMMSNPAPSICS